MSGDRDRNRDLTGLVVSRHKPGRALMPLDRLVVLSPAGEVLWDVDAIDARAKLVLPSIDALQAVLEGAVVRKLLVPVAGQPWTYIASDEAQVAAWRASARLVRRRYADEEAA